MNSHISRLLLCMAGLLFLLPAGWAAEKRLTILFTNDIHSSGDYARMATLIRNEREKAQLEGSAVLLVDAGDIAMGSAFHTLFTEYAFEYVTLGKMGYDAYTFGNHDFDFGPTALAQMFTAAARDSVAWPVPLVANVSPTEPVIAKAFSNAGVKEWTVLRKGIPDRNGRGEAIKIGLFGLMGDHAYSCIACKDSLSFSDRVDTARKMVKILKKEGVDYVICLSHGGTMWASGKKIEPGMKNEPALRAKSEDGRLASLVPELNAILGGHDHEALQTPLVIGKTIIGSAGSKNDWLGKMVLEGDSLAGYELIPVTEAVVPDVSVQEWVHLNSLRVTDRFYKLNNIHLYDTIAFLDRDLSLSMDGEGGLELGSWIASAYRAAACRYVPELSGRTDEVVAIVPYGVFRRSLKKGPLTYNDLFNVLSLGRTQDGSAGYPLVQAWITGRELKDICELNASVAPGMEDARLFFSGLSFEYNSCRLPFTRVTAVCVNGVPVEKEKLYPVVTGMYTARLLGLLKSSSFGLLSAVPKDKEGNLVQNFDEIVIKKEKRQEDGTTGTMEMPEWLSFAEYVQQTELKSPVPEKEGVDHSDPAVYFVYILILFGLGLVIWAAWRLWCGRRLLCRRP